MTHPIEFGDDESRIIEVYIAANTVDAGAVRAALEQNGIRAEIVGDLVGNAFDLPTGVSGPRIWVREADAVAARTLIDQLQEQLGGSSGASDREGDPFRSREPDGDETGE